MAEATPRFLPQRDHLFAFALTTLGRQAADALVRIADLQHAIATTPARTPPEAAVQLRRFAVLLDGQDIRILRLQAALEGQGKTVRLGRVPVRAN